MNDMHLATSLTPLTGPSPRRFALRSLGAAGLALLAATGLGQGLAAANTAGVGGHRHKNTSNGNDNNGRKHKHKHKKKNEQNPGQPGTSAPCQTCPAGP